MKRYWQFREPQERRAFPSETVLATRGLMLPDTGAHATPAGCATPYTAPYTVPLLGAGQKGRLAWRLLRPEGEVPMPLPAAGPIR
jgi:hypothetical protein